VIALLQRVSAARVVVEGEVIAAIDAGTLALLGIERGDGEREAERLIARVLAYRMFGDAQDRMNRSLADTGGALMLVPQFTLAADTDSGLRPSFTPAATPEEGRRLFERCVALARAHHPEVQTGRFGTTMQVHLVNEGPVTFRLRVAPSA